MEAIGSPNCARCRAAPAWVRVDVQTSAGRKARASFIARSSSPLLAVSPAHRPTAEAQLWSLYGKPMRRAPAASRKTRLIQWRKRWRGALRQKRSAAIERRNPRLSCPGRRRKRGDASAGWRLSRDALGDGLEFPDIFVLESKQTFVHFAEAVYEYRDVDFLVFVLVF